MIVAKEPYTDQLLQKFDLVALYFPLYFDTTVSCSQVCFVTTASLKGQRLPQLKCLPADVTVEEETLAIEQTRVRDYFVMTICLFQGPNLNMT